jgi:hypothetical protein
VKQKVLSHSLLILTLLILVSSLPVSGQFYYGLRQEFGKNRVQYNKFDWVFYRYEQFDIYFYRGNDELAAQVSRMAHAELPKIESLLDAPLDERVQILVFNNLSDLKQSNVNSSDDEDYNTGGVTRISGRRLFLHFNGNFIDLRRDLRSGLAEVVLSNMIYGNFTQSIRNSALLNLPEWYTEGLISYIGHANQTSIENKIRDAYRNNRYKNINALIGEDARYAGHSMWSYIADTYGEKVIKNVVYMAIVNRNIESGFLYILGKDLEQIKRDWKDYLKERYQEREVMESYPEKPLIKGKKGQRITQMSVSDDGRYLAYVTQKFSRYKLWVYDYEKERRKKLLTHGFRIAQNADYSYPLLAWHPESKILAMFTEEKGFIYLSFYNTEDKKWQKKTFFKFDKILSFQYSQDGKRFLLSAHKDGQSDIFIYTILNTKVEQLTDDAYNDLYPTFVQNDRRVIWSSNRPTDSLIRNQEETRFMAKGHDLFAMDAREPLKDSVAVLRVTNSPKSNEIRVKEYAPGYVAFLSDHDRIMNRHLIKIDSSIAYVDTITHYSYSFQEYDITDYGMSLLDHAYMPDRDINLDLTYVDNRYRLFETEYLFPEVLGGEPMLSDKQKEIEILKELNDTIFSSTSSDMPLYYPGVNPAKFEVNIYDYKFEDAEESKPEPQDDRLKPKEITQILPSLGGEVLQQPEELEIPPKRNYFLSFFQDDFTVRFDNMFDNPQYQRFTGFVSGDLLNAGFNIQFKVGVIDLMHDYRIIAGMRTNFQPLSGTSLTPNSTFLVGLGDYKNRLDKEYLFTRNSQVLIGNFNNYTRIITNQFMVRTSWPFSPVSAVKGDIGYRIDNTIRLSRDVNSLNQPTLKQDYLVLRGAYVYDNTRKIGLNLYDGLRLKVFTEYYRNLYRSPTGLHTAGFDARNYTLIHRNLIWANRLAAGTSFGPEKLIHIMGGVDNQFSPQFEPTTPIATENNYIFQTLVTNMRGFFQNVRNGNSFAVLNSELRWPIFSYLVQRPIRSDFIKSFQVIGFGDVGTAWNGPSPWGSENVLNTRVIFNGEDIETANVVVTLDSQKDPIVYSYGFGLRTRLFGYYLRFDWAWPVEDGVVLDNEFLFSIGTDF